MLTSRKKTWHPLSCWWKNAPYQPIKMAFGCWGRGESYGSDGRERQAGKVIASHVRWRVQAQPILTHKDFTVELVCRCFSFVAWTRQIFLSRRAGRLRCNRSRLTHPGSGLRLFSLCRSLKCYWVIFGWKDKLSSLTSCTVCSLPHSWLSLHTWPGVPFLSYHDDCSLSAW